MIYYTIVFILSGLDRRFQMANLQLYNFQAIIKLFITDQWRIGIEYKITYEYLYKYKSDLSANMCHEMLHLKTI